MPIAYVAPILRGPTLVEEVCQRLSNGIRAEIDGGDGWLPPERALAEKLNKTQSRSRAGSDQ